METNLTATAFKHPQCAGLIMMAEQDGHIYFVCDTCQATAEELEVLAIGKPVILRRTRRSNRNQVAPQVEESRVGDY